jgi:hypothetical protein
MVIGRGRRREHPQPTFCTTTTKKKVREKSTKKKYGENIRGEKVRGKKYGKKSKGKSHVTSGDVTSGQACAMVRSPSIPRKCDFVRTHILLLCVPGSFYMLQ